jgi:hypothetical protein
MVVELYVLDERQSSRQLTQRLVWVGTGYFPLCHMVLVGEIIALCFIVTFAAT